MSVIDTIKFNKIVKNHKKELKHYIDERNYLMKHFVDKLNNFYTNDHNHVFTFDINNKCFYLIIRKIVDRGKGVKPLIDIDKIIVLYDNKPENEEHFVNLSYSYDNAKVRIVNFNRFNYDIIDKSIEELVYLAACYIDSDREKSLPLYHPYLNKNYEVTNTYLSLDDYFNSLNFDDDFVIRLKNLKKEKNSILENWEVIFRFFDYVDEFSPRKIDYLHSKSLVFKRFYPKDILEKWQINCDYKYMYHYRYSYLYILIYSEDKSYVEYVLVINFLGTSFDTLLRTKDVRIIKFNKSVGQTIEVDSLDNIVVHNKFDKLYSHIDKYNRFYSSIKIVDILTSVMKGYGSTVVDRIIGGGF